MQRTIEKLAHDRRELEGRLHKQLDELTGLARSLEGLEKRLTGLSEPGRKRIVSRAPNVPEVWADLALAIGQVKTLAETCASLLATSSALGEARDKEWDALGNNHVGMIFKSMEWRVDRLASAYEDVSAMAKTFVLLQDRLGRLNSALDEKRLPASADVREILEPLRDWRYLRFENLHRGARDVIRAKQERYLEWFKPGGMIADLGCGRGEFLELLRERGFQGWGVDLNMEMVGICRDRGLDVRRADILEALAERPDASLDGVFSAQVIEHLSAAQLERLIELASAKIVSGGALVLETINPASVFGLVHVYFMDLTHRLPVHPQALRFLLETAGFQDVRILETADLAEEKLRPLPAAAEHSAILNDDIDRLNRLLFAAPEYAAAGRKN